MSLDQNFKLRRSALFMPAANARALNKACTLPADCLIMDLEDSVAPEMKQVARDTFRAAITENDYGTREIILRVNAMDTEYGQEDIAQLAKLPMSGILLPKINTAEDVEDALQVIDLARGSDDLPIWIMAETPRCILNLASIAASSPRLSCIVLGSNDLIREMRAKHTLDRSPLLTAMSLCVMAARAYGLDVLDGVPVSLHDEVGLRQTCLHARELGFDGKTLIHPCQVEITNKIFSPTIAEIEQAHRVVTAWNEAIENGKGVAVLDGRLIEHLHVMEAQRLLEMERAFQPPLAKETIQPVPQL